MFEIFNSPYVMLVVVLALLVITFFAFKKKKVGEKGVYQRKQFLTKNEQDCFFHLMREFPDYIISPQVSMGAVLKPILEENETQSYKSSEATILRNKIGSKIIDFVMLNKKTLDVAFIIELDDKSHDVKKEQDQIRDKHLLLAGIPTARFRRENGKFPNRANIEKMINK